MLTALLVAMDLAGSLAVSDRTELRMRVPGTLSAPASLDAETTLTSRLALTRPAFGFTLGYAPRFTVWDMSSSAARPTLFHTGDARLEWRGRHAQVAVQETAGYGGVDLSTMPLTVGPDGQPPRPVVVPSPQILEIASSTTTLSTRIALRRLTFTASAGYALSGGADAAAQRILPRETGPQGDAGLDVALTRRDHAEAALTASEGRFSSGQEVVLAGGTLGCRHAWTRTTETRLAAGLTEARVRTDASAAPAFDAHPVIEGSLDRRGVAAGHLDFRLGVRLGPTVNPLVGFVDERVEGSLAATHRAGRVTTHLLAAGSRSVPPRGPNATSLFAGELATAYDATRVVVVDGGVRGLWQRQESNGLSFALATLFLGVTLRAPPLRW